MSFPSPATLDSPLTEPLRPNILVVMTDRFHLAGVGAYGNGFAETCAFDRLAVDSTLFDQFYADTLDLHQLHRRFWTGSEGDNGEVSAPNPSLGPRPPSLASLGKKQGYRSIFLTDIPELAGCHDGFEEILLPQTERNEPVESVEETAAFAFFSEMAQIVKKSEEDTPPWLLWGAFSGFGGGWDWPMSLRALFVEDADDPPPYSGTAVPYFELTEPPGRIRGGSPPQEPDFDRLQSVVEAYHGGVAAWDRGLETLLAELDRIDFWRNGWLVVGGLRGFPLGEHGLVGIPPTDSSAAQGTEGRLYAEEIHVPLLIRFPDTFQIGGGSRSSGLCGPTDLYRTLAAVLLRAERFCPLPRRSTAEERLPTEHHKPFSSCLRYINSNAEDAQNLLLLAFDPNDSIRTRLDVTFDGGTDRLHGVITPQWYLRVAENFSEDKIPPDDTNDMPDARISLFVKPDDRWDVNDVANREPAIVEQLLNGCRTAKTRPLLHGQ